MTWLSNSQTQVRCNDPDHKGPEVFVVETAYWLTAREALIRDGWGYDHGASVHVCPICIRRNVRRN